MLGINISAYLKVLLYIITACQTMVKFGNEVNPKVYSHLWNHIKPKLKLQGHYYLDYFV